MAGRGRVKGVSSSSRPGRSESTRSSAARGEEVAESPVAMAATAIDPEGGLQPRALIPAASILDRDRVEGVGDGPIRGRGRPGGGSTQAGLGLRPHLLDRVGVGAVGRPSAHPRPGRVRRPRRPPAFSTAASAAGESWARRSSRADASRDDGSVTIIRVCEPRESRCNPGHPGMTRSLADTPGRRARVS